MTVIKINLKQIETEGYDFQPGGRIELTYTYKNKGEAGGKFRLFISETKESSENELRAGETYTFHLNVPLPDSLLEDGGEIECRLDTSTEGRGWVTIDRFPLKRRSPTPAAQEKPIIGMSPTKTAEKKIESRDVAPDVPATQTGNGDGDARIEMVPDRVTSSAATAVAPLEHPVTDAKATVTVAATPDSGPQQVHTGRTPLSSEDRADKPDFFAPIAGFFARLRESFGGQRQDEDANNEPLVGAETLPDEDAVGQLYPLSPGLTVCLHPHGRASFVGEVVNSTGGFAQIQVVGKVADLAGGLSPWVVKGEVMQVAPGSHKFTLGVRATNRDHQHQAIPTGEYRLHIIARVSPERGGILETEWEVALTVLDRPGVAIGEVTLTDGTPPDFTARGRALTYRAQAGGAAWDPRRVVEFDVTVRCLGQQQTGFRLVPVDLPAEATAKAVERAAYQAGYRFSTRHRQWRCLVNEEVGQVTPTEDASIRVRLERPGFWHLGSFDAGEFALRAFPLTGTADTALPPDAEVRLRAEARRRLMFLPLWVNIRYLGAMLLVLFLLCLIGKDFPAWLTEPRNLVVENAKEEDEKAGVYLYADEERNTYYVFDSAKDPTARLRWTRRLWSWVPWWREADVLIEGPAGKPSVSVKRPGDTIQPLLSPSEATASWWRHQATIRVTRGATSLSATVVFIRNQKNTQLRVTNPAKRRGPDSNVYDVVVPVGKPENGVSPASIGIRNHSDDPKIVGSGGTVRRENRVILQQIGNLSAEDFRFEGRDLSIPVSNNKNDIRNFQIIKVWALKPGVSGDLVFYTTEATTPILTFKLKAEK